MNTDWTTLELSIREAINKACSENDSNTPDYILAEYLSSCLDAFNHATRQRDSWYGFKPEPGSSSHLEPEANT